LLTSEYLKNTTGGVIFKAEKVLKYRLQICGDLFRNFKESEACAAPKLKLKTGELQENLQRRK